MNCDNYWWIDELVLFMTRIKEYTYVVVDQINPYEVIKHHPFRDSCTQTFVGRFVKEFSLLGQAMRWVIKMDDNPNAYLLQPRNVVHVSSFVNDLYDMKLSNVVSLFKVFARL